MIGLYNKCDHKNIIHSIYEQKCDHKNIQNAFISLNLLSLWLDLSNIAVEILSDSADHKAISWAKIWQTELKIFSKIYLMWTSAQSLKWRSQITHRFLKSNSNTDLKKIKLRNWWDETSKKAHIAPGEKEWRLFLIVENSINKLAS